VRIFFTLLLALASMLPCPESHAQVIGTRAEEWQVSSWINSSPLALNDLAGKVVLVRWWTAPSCPYCKASSSAINEWHSRYQDQGLVVIGFYHHKSSAPLKPDDVKSYAETLGFDFPVAVDDDWTTLKRWWLSRNPDAKWTSVSFLIDRNGIRNRT
jgi:thiol-disulfide isomerase/thioredoxin